MKKLLYIIGILGAIFTSCQKDETFDISSEPFTLSLSLDGTFEGEEPQAKSRTDASTIDNYMVAVFHDNEYWREEADIFDDGDGGKTNFATSTDGRFALTLDRTKDYYFAFWADQGNGTYDFNGSYSSVNLKGNKLAEEAFAGTYALVAGDKFNGNIKLKRAVAKVSLRNSGAMEAGKNIVLNYSAHTSYLIATREPQYSLENITATLTTTEAAAGEEFASVWIMAPDRVFTTDITYNYDNQGDNLVEDVPYQANRRTNLKGEYAPPVSFMLADFSATEYPTDTDEWTINDAGELPAADFTGLIAALKTIESAGNTRLIKLTFPNITAVPDFLFYNRDVVNVSSFSAENAITIGEYAFYYCDALATVDLPAATTIRDCAFYGCDALTTITLPKATTIRGGAFYRCDALTTITLPKATSIGDSAFDRYPLLTTLNIGKGETTDAVITNIGTHWFGGSYNPDDLAKIDLKIGNVSSAIPAISINGNIMTIDGREYTFKSINDN